MSLLNTASPWNSSGTDTRKRISAIGKEKRKTQKAPLPLRDEDVDNSGLSSYHPDFEDNADVSESMQNTIELNKSRGSTINDLLNKITSSQVGEGLADFTPVSTVKDLANPKEGFESPLLKMAAGIPEYGPSDIGSDNLSNYNKSYEAGAILGKPYYSQSTKNGDAGDGVMQKLNYITHILEDIQMEKTSNITEELILYTFLGVFTIFIVDAFARVGKYHR
jgi:hypothetical protein